MSMCDVFCNALRGNVSTCVWIGVVRSDKLILLIYWLVARVRRAVPGARVCRKPIACGYRGAGVKLPRETVGFSRHKGDVQATVRDHSRVSWYSLHPSGSAQGLAQKTEDSHHCVITAQEYCKDEVRRPKRMYLSRSRSCVRTVPYGYQHATRAQSPSPRASRHAPHRAPSRRRSPTRHTHARAHTAHARSARTCGRARVTPVCVTVLGQCGASDRLSLAGSPVRAGALRSADRREQSAPPPPLLQ